jgi:hypothetical protein
MSITSVITPAPSRGLTTVDALKARVDTGIISDEILLQDIEAWSLRFEQEVGRVFAKERVEQTDVGAALGMVVLERRPVLEVHSVTIEGRALGAERYHLDDPDGGLLRLDNTMAWRSFMMGDASPGLGDNLVSARYVTNYTGGYVLPGWAVEYGDRTLPIDIELAIIEAMRMSLASAGVGGSGSASAGVTAERLGDYSVSYASSISEMGAPSAFLQAVSRYRGVF